MAKAKYTRGADGYFSTKVWDGTYNPVTGQKNRKNLRTKKSSKALEDMVNEFKANVTDRKNIRNVDITFFQYARKWKEVTSTYPKRKYPSIRLMILQLESPYRKNQKQIMATEPFRSQIRSIIQLPHI